MNGYMKSSLKIYFSTPEIDFSLVFVCEIILVSRIMLVIVIVLGFKMGGCLCLFPSIELCSLGKQKPTFKKIKVTFELDDAVMLITSKCGLLRPQQCKWCLGQAAVSQCYTAWSFEGSCWSWYSYSNR